ncbi:MAG: arginine/agmatine antiporter, partial [Burkholderia vietnamiensis]|nr:arginine/agmatine antiporter [Burkholderia vietnamiensis]
QTAKAAADDGLFASVFARVNSKNVPSAGLAIVAVIMTVQVLATMSPSASQQFGKIASIAVIMTLLPYIYSCIAIKVLGYGKMPPHQFTFYTIVGLIGAVYSLWAMVGSDGQQTRWSLIFVIATIVFYELSINRQREIEETHVHPGGRSPRWVRYFALGVTIVALAATFWISVGQHEADLLHARSPAAGVAATQHTGE